MIRAFQYLAFATFGSFAAYSTASAQHNDYNYVKVCNKGNVDIQYVAFATKSTFLGGDEAKLSAWYKIKSGKCRDVNLPGYHAVSVGFLQENNQGVVGNPVYQVSNADRTGATKWSPGVVCVPEYDRITEKGGLGYVRGRILPPCKNGHREFRMSFYVKPNDVYPTINIRPRRNDKLVPWRPAVGASASTSRQSSPSNSGTGGKMSNAEILARIAIGAAKGLEDGKVRKLSAACQKSTIVFALALAGKDAGAACDCISRKMVRGEPAANIDTMIRRLDAGDDFEDVTNHMGDAEAEKYMAPCLS